jgi:hypothetical protein
MYILVDDKASSNWVRGKIFFNCSGDKVVPESDLWNELFEAHNRNINERILVWKKPFL